MSIRCITSFIGDAIPSSPWSQSDLEVNDMTLLLKFSGHDPATGVQHFLFDVVRGGLRIGECNLTLGQERHVQYCGNIGSNFPAPFYGRPAANELFQQLFRLARQAGLSHALLTFPPESRLIDEFCHSLGGTHMDTVSVPKDDELSKQGANWVKRYRVSL